MRAISKRAQEALNDAGKITPALRELVLFAAQNPGLSSYDFQTDQEYKAATRDISTQWNTFRLALRMGDLSRITDRRLVGAANDRLYWSKEESRWKLTNKWTDREAALKYRQEAIDLLLRAMKG